MRSIQWLNSASLHELELSAEAVATLTAADYQRLREIGATPEMVKTVRSLARQHATPAQLLHFVREPVTRL